MTPDEMLATTRSVRRRLDFDRTVDPELLEQCLSLALQAPTGSLRQDWHFVASTEARHLADNFPRIPAILVPCISGRLDGAPAALQALRWGSVIQATWSFMLAARVRGIGTCWTTVHLAAEEEVADVLGIPFADIQQVALIPIAHTLGTDFKPGARKDMSDFVHWNGW